MIIRCDASQLEQVVPLFDAYRQFYRRSGDIDGARRFLQDRLSRGESVMFAALNGARKFVGFTQLYPLFSSVSMRPMWLLNDLFVIPECRRSGWGRALLDAARDWARQSDARGVMLETEAANTDAQRLYESTGYRRNTNFFYELEV
jgi:ribosomal protein S18 acetylase RimI-like enzyme